MKTLAFSRCRCRVAVERRQSSKFRAGSINELDVARVYRKASLFPRDFRNFRSIFGVPCASLDSNRKPEPT